MSVIEQVRDRVKGDAIAKAEYQKLFDALEEIRAPADPAWVQAWIALNCAAKQRAFGTQRLMSRYNRQCRRRGKVDEFDEFLRHIQDDLGFYLPNGSSYGESFRGVDTGAVMAQCGALAEELAGHDLQVFANSGTLLGIVREGGLLAHDNDFDFGVLLQARTAEAAAAEWMGLCDRLIAQGIAVERSSWSKVTLKLKKIGQFGVDLFPAWIDENDRVFVYPHTFGELSRAQLLPYSLHAPTGLHIPSDPEAMLVCNYGEDWRVPDAGWTFPWKPANEKFAAFRDALT